jgi:hypothetical protein
MTDPILARIQVATSEMAEAEGELELALQEMRGRSRAEKTTVTTVVEAALERLRAAKAAVVELEELLRSPR